MGWDPWKISYVIKTKNKKPQVIKMKMENITGDKMH